MSPRVVIFFRRLLHYSWYVLGAAVSLVCLIALLLRFWLMPDIERFRPDIEQIASQAVGYPVRVSHIEANWQGIHPRVVLNGVSVRPAADQVLSLPRVEISASWLSLVSFDLRLHRLLIEGAQLDLQRDKAGVITLSGLPLNQGGTPSPFPDWLLRQPQVLIKDAHISWLDELLDAPQLRLDQVRLLLTSHFGRHRFNLIALPSASAARRLELRGDLRGRSSRNPAEWHGSLYTQVDGARFENWGRWVPWAQDAVRGGVGDVRFWTRIEAGQILGTLGDADLRGVAVNLQSGLPDLLFSQLKGRLGWSRKADEHSFFVDNLRFQIPTTRLSDPASVRVDLRIDSAGKISRVGATARNLRLEAFTALSGTLPLPRRAHDLLEALRPRGLVEKAEGHWTHADDYAFRASLQDAGIEAHDMLPGFAGVSASLRGDQRGGEVDIDGRDSQIDLPRVFRAPLGFSAIDAHAGWHFDTDGLRLDYQARRIANADLEGHSQGSLWFPRKGSAEVDIQARLSRGEAQAVHRYLPRVVSDDAHAWLKRGLQGGRSNDTLLVLKGPLDRFPFDQGGGQFVVSVRMLDGVLDYAPGWPRIEGVHGQLVFHDKAMELTAHSGRILAAQLGPVKAVIPDLMYSHDEIVLVDGKARGSTTAFLEFVRRSPVDDHTGRFAGHLKAEGDTELDLHLALPTRHLDDTSVRGTLSLADNRINPGAGLPELKAVNGRIDFTSERMKSRELRATVLDMPATLDLASQPNGQVKVQLAGRAGAELLKPHLPAKLHARLGGSVGWQADLLMHAGQAAETRIRSDLVGLAINLPAPAGKQAEQPLPLDLRIVPGKNQGLLLAQLGSLASLRLPLGGKGPQSASLRLGSGEAAARNEPGLWVAGSLHELDLDAWRSQDLFDGGGDSRLPLREASLAFNELRLFNHRLHDTHVRLNPQPPGWQISVNGKEIQGDITTRPQAGGQFISGKFKRLHLPAEEAGAVISASQDSASEQLAGLEIDADSFAWKEHALGALQLSLQPERLYYRLDRLALTTTDGKLEAHGQIARHPRRESRIEFNTSSNNLGKVLARVGQDGVMKGGDMQAQGRLGWTGGLGEFSVDGLNSDISVLLKDGQFLKVDPGAAKLIGILSLQSLPRRISLDFRDVFSQGFAFDEIKGSAHLESGAAYFREVRMLGPAAKVRISGMADMRRETQQLRVTVEPSIEDTAALAAGLIGGPAVGIGTFIANKVLKNPIGQAVTFNYQVSGGWANPKVEKLAPENQADPLAPDR